MSTTIRTRQASASTAVIEWTTTDTFASWEIERQITNVSSLWVTIAVVEANFREFADTTLAADGVVLGDTVTYRLVDPAGPSVIVTASPFTMVDLSAPFTYGPVDPLADTIRYTTLADVKLAAGITDDVLDVELTQAIIAGEVAIDMVNGRSFPDTGINPEIAGIPQGVRVWALDVAIEVWKLRDTVAGFTAGADDWIGTIDVLETARRAIRRNPLSLGWRIAWGLA